MMILTVRIAVTFSTSSLVQVRLQQAAPGIALVRDTAVRKMSPSDTVLIRAHRESHAYWGLKSTSIDEVVTRWWPLALQAVGEFERKYLVGQ